MPGLVTLAMAMCRSDDFCGYLSENCIAAMIRLANELSVDFFQIANHPNLQTKVYNYREAAVRVAMETSKPLQQYLLNQTNIWQALDQVETENSQGVDFWLDAS